MKILTKEQRRNNFKIAVSLLRGGTGITDFIIWSIVRGVIAFLFIVGFRYIGITQSLFHYGLEKGLAELHVVTGVDAVLAVNKLVFGNSALMFLASIIIGLAFGSERFIKQYVTQ